MAESQVLSHVQNALWHCQPVLGVATTLYHPKMPMGFHWILTLLIHIPRPLWGQRSADPTSSLNITRLPQVAAVVGQVLTGVPAVGEEWGLGTHPRKVERWWEVGLGQGLEPPKHVPFSLWTSLAKHKIQRSNHDKNFKTVVAEH